MVRRRWAVGGHLAAAAAAAVVEPPWQTQRPAVCAFSFEARLSKGRGMCWRSLRALRPILKGLQTVHSILRRG